MKESVEKKRQKGFTMIEVLVTIAILGIMAGFGVLGLTSYKNRHSFELDSQNIVEAIRNTQNRAILGENGQTWGIKFTNTTTGGYYEIFAGSSYASSTIAARDVLSSATKFVNPAPGFTKTIIFSPVIGKPDNADVVVLKKNIDSDIYLISISSLGAVDRIYEKSLVGYWPFDEELGSTGYDASPYGDNTSLIGSPIWQVRSACRVGSCVLLDGSSQYGEVAHSSTVDPTDEWTISAWVKTAVTGAQHSIVEKYDWISGKGNYALRIDSSNKFVASVINGVSSQTCGTTSTTINAGTWYFVAATFNKATTKLTCYVNGVPEASNTSANINPPSSSVTLKLGARGNDWGSKMNGRIDEVRIYKRAFSDAEIKNLYQGY